MAQLGFVVSEFNREITKEMEDRAHSAAESLDADVVETVYVPGTYDMPLAVKKLCERDDIDGVVTIGVVIEGATEHDEVVAHNAASKFADLSIEYDKPVALGVIGPGMSRLEAQQRVEHGERAVKSAVKMVERLEE